ncbi:MAG: bile acid:sodium symporter [Sphingomonadaceae bacterium]|nr:bile acid:sodium symporter [Sphingomonadaceae bacterium]
MAQLIPDRFVLMLLGAVLLGWLLPVSGGGLPIAQNIAFVGIFALFFLHGLKLPREEVYQAAKGWRLQGSMLLFTFSVMPLVGLAVSKAAAPWLPPLLAAGLLYCAILPSTVQSAISYSSLGKGNVAASVVGAALSNLVGIIVTPGLFALFLGGVAGGDLGGDVVVKILTMLLLPFALGQVAQRWLGAWAAREKRLLSFFDRGVILLAVYVAFSSAVSSGALARVKGVDLLGLLVAASVLLAFAFGAAWLVGRALKFSQADRVSLLFAGAHKSLATGAPMAALLFSPEIAGVMILPAIFYHQLQLIASAPLAGRLARAKTPQP